MFDMVLNGFAMFWYPWPLALLNPSEPSPQLPTTKLYKTNRWETWEVQRILATHHGFHHFPSCFQTGLVQTSSILVLDHPWFNSLVPCLTWFWMVLLCFDTPGLWHCWTLSTTKPYKTSWLSMTRHEVGHHCSHCQSVALQLEWHLGWEQGKEWETWEVQRILASHHGFHHFPSCFQTGLVQTSSILVLDHPWFYSLVPCLTWFWNVFEWFCYVLIPLAPGTAEPIWTLPTTKPFKTSWWTLPTHHGFPSFSNIMFSNRSCPNLFYFSTGPPLV